MNIESVKTFLTEKFSDKLAETLEWCAIVLVHAATIPTVLAGLAGITDKMPPVDMVVFIWTALLVYFVKAALQRKYLMMITIGVGFFVHAMLMAMLFFR